MKILVQGWKCTIWILININFLLNDYTKIQYHSQWICILYPYLDSGFFVYFFNLLEENTSLFLKSVLYYLLRRWSLFLYLITLWIYFVILSFLNNFPFFNSFCLQLLNFYSFFLYCSCTIVVYFTIPGYFIHYGVVVATISRPDILKLIFAGI